MNNTSPRLSDLPAPPDGRRGWPWTEATPFPGNNMPDGTPWPRISIVTPSFNQGQFIEETIRSVLLQGYPNLEYFVMDGGSRDNSVNVIEKYAPWLTDWVSAPDNGQASAINTGLALAGGQILGYLNSDDTYLPGALARVSQLAAKGRESVAWVGGCNIVDAGGNLIESILPRNVTLEGISRWYYEGFFYQPGAFFSAAAYQDAGPFDESLNCAFDLDMWLRLARIGPFAVTDDLLATAKRHGANKTVIDRYGLHAETIGVLHKAGFHDAARLRLSRAIESELRLTNVGAKYLRRLKRRLEP